MTRLQHEPSKKHEMSRSTALSMFKSRSDLDARVRALALSRDGKVGTLKVESFAHLETASTLHDLKLVKLPHEIVNLEQKEKGLRSKLFDIQYEKTSSKEWNRNDQEEDEVPEVKVALRQHYPHQRSANST